MFGWSVGWLSSKLSNKRKIDQRTTTLCMCHLCVCLWYPEQVMFVSGQAIFFLLTFLNPGFLFFDKTFFFSSFLFHLINFVFVFFSFCLLWWIFFFFLLFYSPLFFENWTRQIGHQVLVNRFCCHNCLIDFCFFSVCSHWNTWQNLDFFFWYAKKNDLFKFNSTRATHSTGYIDCMSVITKKKKILQILLYE